MAVATFRAFCVLRSAFESQGGRPPFDPPPVMPRGGDPPSTPRRSCPGGTTPLRPPAGAGGALSSVLGRGCGGARVGCCHVSGRSAFCVDSQGGRPPFDPPPVLVANDRGLGRGCGGARVGRCYVSGRSTFYVLRCTSGRSAFDAQGGRPPFDPPPVLVAACFRAWPGVRRCSRWPLPRSGRSTFYVLRFTLYLWAFCV